jgi:biotin carboxylase
VLDDKTRVAMGEAAVRLAKAANYTSAGTVEFLLDKDKNFYFIEINSRIQVEHPVTEAVTDTDLIREMILVAAGERLSFRQEDIRMRGHAMEFRINAEDPDHNFKPSPGTIHTFVAPAGPGVRWDSHIYQGYTVPPHYDSMVGKLIVHRPTRKMAIEVARRALRRGSCRRRARRPQRRAGRRWSPPPRRRPRCGERPPRAAPPRTCSRPRRTGAACSRRREPLRPTLAVASPPAPLRPSPASLPAR